MHPMSMYTGRILLQTTPTHVVPQLDRCLREALTIDGVLEFKNEHFWTVSFGKLAGSLTVRVRRNADEQLVLAHITDKLANLVWPLTIQISKDNDSSSERNGRLSHNDNNGHAWRFRDDRIPDMSPVNGQQRRVDVKNQGIRFGSPEVTGGLILTSTPKDEDDLPTSTPTKGQTRNGLVVNVRNSQDRARFT